jgi:hypothetical protein
LVETSFKSVIIAQIIFDISLLRASSLYSGSSTKIFTSFAVKPLPKHLGQARGGVIVMVVWRTEVMRGILTKILGLWFLMAVERWEQMTVNSVGGEDRGQQEGWQNWGKEDQLGALAGAAEAAADGKKIQQGIFRCSHNQQ